ncbi:cysteine--tRNA ligase CysS [Methyloglobulus morosus KoM1]|uniref:Cysteine--tRNA ligase n=2 Tax=Methyloglobulus TaxID=1410680 RepID=V5BFN5_9GAMM|nr:cysteine--tRNA ligase CysS [Methyloglobulus morosus KoM1]
MYVCGMTVYDYCHIGHARVMVVFDTVARYFRHKGYELTYVRNITDIDDKIINRANENGEEFTALTQRFIDAMHEDERALSVLPPDVEPKATQSIPAIIAMIATLINKGLAYVGTNGDVFYSVSKFTSYGKLSGKNLADLQAGERVDVDQAKQDPLDFVLWKMAKPGEPSWNSPWGQGRPGWHIECSAMSTCCLGNHFDIHGGGMDLQFPHHENEIAQSEGATGETFVNVWMHNGFVRVDNEKMSKSLGNFFTLKDVRVKYKPEVIRFFILQSHYRSPLNYSDQQLNEAKTALERLYTALDDVLFLEDSEQIVEYQERFNEAMNDDFNTPVAISVLFDLATELNIAKTNKSQNIIELASTLRNLGDLLGILQLDSNSWFGRNDRLESSYEMTDEDWNELAKDISKVPKDLPFYEIEKLKQIRLDAKRSKNWALADQIRDELKQQGIILEDRPDGTTSWRRE